MTAVRRIAIALGAVVLVVILALAMVYRDPLRSLVSIRRVDDHPLFVMRLYGDGGVADPRAVRGVAAASTTPAVEAEWACTCSSAENSAGGRLFGRNFDWHNRPALVLFAEPRDGYASAAISDIYLLSGSGRYVGEDADALTLADRIRLLDAVLIPFDGMNERGLVVGMMAVPTVPVLHHPGGPVLGSLQAIRLMLDRAATVEEALTLLRRVNVTFAGGPQVHYLLADAAGDAALVEYTREGMHVVRSPDPWQVSTNFAFDGDTVPGADSPCGRYNAVYGALQATGGVTSATEAMGLLEGCSQESTRWSAVYDQAGGEVLIAVGRDYQNMHRFWLDMAVEGMGRAN